MTDYEAGIHDCIAILERAARDLTKATNELAPCHVMAHRMLPIMAESYRELAKELRGLIKDAPSILDAIAAGSSGRVK